MEVIGLDAPPVLLAVAPGGPAPAAAAIRPTPETDSLESRIIRRFSGHEPIYFLVGVRSPLLVALNWLWQYLTYAQGARLITGGR